MLHSEIDASGLQCFKNSSFDAIAKVPVALPLKMSLTWKQKYGKS